MIAITHQASCRRAPSTLAVDEGAWPAPSFDDRAFDAVVCHTTLCHVTDCEEVLAEAHRLLRPGGELAVFDGDHAPTTVALSAGDPLQRASEARSPRSCTTRGWCVGLLR